MGAHLHLALSAVLPITVQEGEGATSPPLGETNPQSPLDLPHRRRDCPESIERVDCVRDREPERRRDSDPLAAIVERLGHHRVGEHGEDRTCSEGEHEAHRAR